MWYLIIPLTALLLVLLALHNAIHWWKKRSASRGRSTEESERSVRSYELSQKDSLDEHLDLLTQKLASKESKLRVSKSKIRQTQNEIESLQAIDKDVQNKYRDIMENLKNDLTTNEKDCKLLQQQIEWVSRRRAELKCEVVQGQNMYTEAATELAKGLRDVQRAARPLQPIPAGSGKRYCNKMDTAKELWASFDAPRESRSSLRARSLRRNDSRQTEIVATALLEPHFY